MAQGFDFNKIKRSFFTVQLKDGRKLLVKMPMKKTFEKMNTINGMDDEITPNEAMDELGSICAEILSNNMKGDTVTTEYMVDSYDTEEMTMFVEGYMDLVSGVKSDPN